MLLAIQQYSIGEAALGITEHCTLMRLHEPSIRFIRCERGIGFGDDEHS